MNTIGNRILIIDSDKNFLESASHFLLEKGYEVYEASQSIQGVEIAKSVIPHLILLDIDFSDVNGIEACQNLREILELNSTLIVFVSTHNEDFVQIACFKAGADDYFTKPLKNNVLHFRIQALLKRQSSNNHPLNANNIESDTTIEIDSEKFIVKVGRNNVSLPKKQFFLLQLLMSYPSKVYTRDTILELVWGNKNRIGGRAVDVYIRKLREKIGSKHIVTIKGVGYRFDH
ncbi:MAG: DNA-binding response regulator [Bacteroidales bacterium]|nr:MAG: DNA-binding response regulator [Bacteroidales bacterium]